MPPPMAVIVGARTSHQGTGPWIARILHEAGYRIGGVIASNLVSAQKAAQEFAESWEIETIALARLEDLVETPDLVVIASPAPTHRHYIEFCAQKRWPMLCEKPFIWDPARDNIADALALAEILDETATPLWLNTQWIESLRAYEALHPGVDLKKAQQFDVKMSPASQGTAMLVDALPHVAAFLLHLAPHGEWKNLDLRWNGTQYCHLSATWICPKTRPNSPLAVNCELISTPTPPRPFAYAFDGHWVIRRVNLADYSFSFETQEGIFPIDDPLKTRVLKSLSKPAPNSDNRYSNNLTPTPPQHLIRMTRMLAQAVSLTP